MTRHKIRLSPSPPTAKELNKTSISRFRKGGGDAVVAAFKRPKRYKRTTPKICWPFHERVVGINVSTCAVGKTTNATERLDTDPEELSPLFCFILRKYILVYFILLWVFEYETRVWSGVAYFS